MIQRFDVVIVGGGMVGSALALALARADLRVALLEAAEPPAFDPAQPHDIRVSAITRASQRVFERLDAWRGMRTRRISPYQAMEVWDAAGSGVIRFHAEEIGEPDLGHIIENRVIQLALLDGVRRLPAITLFCPAALAGLDVDDRAARVRLDDGRVLEAPLAVGADGARSRLRELAGIEVEIHSYHQQAVTCTVATELPHLATAWQRFLPAGPLAFLPLSDGQCSIVWSTGEAHAEEIMALDDAAFREVLGEAFAHRLGTIIDSGSRGAFPLRGSQAGVYVRPRVALVGDAAHTIHPLAGQGVNLGLMDAATLADVLLGAGGRDLGDLRVLRRYERARRGEDIIMMRAMEGFRALFGNPLPPVQWLRNTGLDVVDRIGPLKRGLIRRAMGLAGELPSLARA